MGDRKTKQQTNARIVSRGGERVLRFQSGNESSLIIVEKVRNSNILFDIFCQLSTEFFFYSLCVASIEISLFLGNLKPLTVHIHKQTLG